MKKLTRNQWIGVAVALLVAGFMFYGIQFILPVFGGSSLINQESAVRKDVIDKGEGEGAEIGDKLIIHYVGRLVDGTVFDSSYDSGEPIEVVLGGGDVIAGWDQGLLGVKAKEKAKLVIPPEFAYKEGGFPDGRGGYIIPPNATLIFEIEVVSLEKKSK